MLSGIRNMIVSKCCNYKESKSIHICLHLACTHTTLHFVAHQEDGTQVQEKPAVLNQIEVVPSMKFHLPSQHDKRQEGDDDQQEVVDQDHGYDVTSPHDLHPAETVQDGRVELPELPQLPGKGTLLGKLWITINDAQFIRRGQPGTDLSLYLFKSPFEKLEIEKELVTAVRVSSSYQYT